MWFDRASGFYGWLDTSFPAWVDNLALVPAGLIALLGPGAHCSRAAATPALSEIVVYDVWGSG